MAPWQQRLINPQLTSGTLNIYGKADSRIRSQGSPVQHHWRTPSQGTPKGVGFRKLLTTMPANTTELEKRLWGAADELRANSKLKSSEYSVPVLGLIFLKYADHKFAQA